jgi:hypothetical protein
VCACVVAVAADNAAHVVSLPLPAARTPSSMHLGPLGPLSSDTTVGLFTTVSLRVFVNAGTWYACISDMPV